MGTKDMRDAFNTGSQPTLSCLTATLQYAPGDGGDWQNLTFSGTTNADGSAFLVTTSVEPHGDPVAAALALGQSSAAAAKTPPKEPPPQQKEPTP
jgi:hypothetical protein